MISHFHVEMFFTIAITFFSVLIMVSTQDTHSKAKSKKVERRRFLSFGKRKTNGKYRAYNFFPLSPGLIFILCIVLILFRLVCFFFESMEHYHPYDLYLQAIILLALFVSSTIYKQKMEIRELTKWEPDSTYSRLPKVV